MEPLCFVYTKSALLNKHGLYVGTYAKRKSLFRKDTRMKIFLLFKILYPKINMNVVKTISPWE